MNRTAPGVLHLVALMLVAAAGCGSDPAPSTAATGIADCAEMVIFEGRVYEHDLYNDDALAVGHLGPRLGEVTERLTRCGDMGEFEMPSPDSYDGIAGFLVPMGTEINAVPGEADRSLIAAVVPAGVWFFRALDSDPLDFDAEVDAIGINSDYDGTTRLATITDPSLVSALVEDARSAPLRNTPGSASPDRSTSLPSNAPTGSQ